VDRQFVLRLVHRRQSGGQGRHLAGRVAGFLQPRRLEIASYRAFDVACPDVFIMLYWGHRSPWWLIEDQENLLSAQQHPQYPGRRAAKYQESAGLDGLPASQKAAYEKAVQERQTNTKQD
jgi:hypothetical protein